MGYLVSQNTQVAAGVRHGREQLEDSSRSRHRAAYINPNPRMAQAIVRTPLGSVLQHSEDGHEH